LAFSHNSFVAYIKRIIYYGNPKTYIV